MISHRCSAFNMVAPTPMVPWLSRIAARIDRSLNTAPICDADWALPSGPSGIDGKAPIFSIA